MAEQTQRAEASWNPDDASGLIDNVRARIIKVLVDIFTAKSGSKFVNLYVTYKGDTEFTERYLVGDATQWVPNASKTGVIPVGEGGGKIWNKSQAHRYVKSITDAGFPKNKLGGDLAAAIVGLDVQLLRVTDPDGGTYTDGKGATRPNQTMLVTKLYTDATAIASGAYQKGVPAASGAAQQAASAPATTTAAKAPKKATAAPAAPAAVDADDTSNDEYATELLVGILGSKGPLDKSALLQPSFMQITKDKKSAIRAAVQARITNDAFLAGLAEAGLITFDGTTAALAA